MKRAKRYMSSADLPYLKDENGKPLCRWCKGAVMPPRRSWCSDECVHEFLIRSGAESLRRAVYKRDKGICKQCGGDTDKILRVTSRTDNNDIWQVFRSMGFNRDRFQSLWEADHILEVSAGGETSLENIQTLCVPCHKAKTKQMHADRKFARTGIKPKPPVREIQLSIID